MLTSQLDYDLPEKLIAQAPADQRDHARLMILNRAEQSITLDVFHHLPAHLRAGDCLVLNNTRVIRARLRGRKPSGGNVEIFLLHEEAPGTWQALVRPSGKVKPGTPVLFPGGIIASVENFLGMGRRRIVFNREDILAALEAVGEIPLPPYIHRDTPLKLDADRYQTVFSERPGAVAAPTAGLHYTPEVFEALDAAGVRRTTLTLHVGYGTFKPIAVDALQDHQVDAEDFELPEAAAAILNTTRAEGGRVVAAGTTATRVLESQWREGRFLPGAGQTSKYIYPPYEFRAVDALQTNFHLPRSSLLALVCAFAGRDFVMEAYRRAVAEEFRFYSYGDTMLIV